MSKKCKAPKWTDVTSYSQGADKTPRTWDLELPWCILTVTRHIHQPQDAWIIRCPNFGVDRVAASKDLGDAQAELLVLVRLRCREILEALPCG
jgi:hypothetical protein